MTDDFRDRSRGLVGWGWVWIGAGAVCGLSTLFLVAASQLVPNVPGGTPAAPMLAFDVLVYLAIGGCLAALGVGSIRARRWSRPLALVAGWVWLAIGVVSVLMVVFLVPPSLSASGMPAGTAGCAVAALGIFFSLFLVLLPALLVRFYGREDVRRTIEARDPLPGWTDRVPTVVLSIVVALVFGGAICLFSIPMSRAVPLFGMLVTGMPARLVMLAIAALSFVLAWGSWRRAPAAWWGLVLFQVLSFVNVLAMRSTDVAAIFRESGYPQDGASRVPSEFFRGPLFLLVTGGLSAALLGFLLAVRKHFRGDSPRSFPSN